MGHDSPLIGILVFGLGLAFVFGTIANRLKLSPLVGYLVAGIAIGPFTPGFVADRHLTLELADVGVILLMFGVGLHFSPKDLMSVRRIVIPGAILQVAIAATLGFGVAHWLGWPPGAGIVFGLALSVASTVVMMRALQEHGLMETDRGRIAVGWLVVQDLLTVLTLVLLPPLAGVLKGGAALDAGALAVSLAITFGKLALFAALMFIVGKRAVPWLLEYIAGTGSQELFRLAVLSVALGIAFAAAVLFGVSIALGAFFAGMILSESPLSQRAAEESLPLRDAFAVLFFVSVGMLFDPQTLLREPAALALTLAVVLIGTAGTALVIVRLFGQPWSMAFLIAAGLAQIGEFSFILADLGIGLNLMPERARGLILGTSILTILINPFLIGLAQRFAPKASAA
jgi:monovalent cation:H+ antiporter-2, CPA2 family